MKDYLQYKDYYGSVRFDADELVFHGKVEFIRALISYEATHARGLKKAFEDAVDDYLELCEEQGSEPEVPFKGSLNVRLGPELHRDIAMLAAQHEVSINRFISETLGKEVHRQQ